ncbi:MAG: SRPBCC family protein [Phycisphaerales bacterium]|nr:SRPBCC family protein [Phycisphaerales bacterium]
MPRLTITRGIEAPIGAVFAAVADVRNFAEIQPQIVDITFLSEQRTGVGTRFRETRQMGKRRASVELEVTEHVENDRVRLVSDAHGTVWDTVFTVRKAGEGRTELTMVMDANGKSLLAWMMNPLVMGMVKGAVAADIDRVKAHCEAAASGAAA